MGKQKKVLWNWLVSYIVILIIPLVMVAVNYWKNVNTIKNGLASAYELMADNLSDNIDTYIESERKLFSFLYSNDLFSKILLYKSKNAEFSIDVSALENQVTSYCRDNSDLDCLIYLEKMDYIITKNAANESDYYHNTIMYKYAECPEYEEWMSLISQDYMNELFVTKYINYQMGNECLVLANTCLRNNGGKINVFISIPLLEMQYLTQSLPENAYLTVVRDDKIMFTLSRDGVDKLPESVRMDGTGKMVTNKDFMHVLSESADSNIKYYMVVAKESIETNLVDTRESFLISLLVTLLFGSVGVLVLARWNYQPIRQLVQKIGAEEKDGNEFYNISEFYEKLQNENAASKKIINEQKQQLRNSWLLSLMKGRTTGLMNREKEEYFDFNAEMRVALVGFMIPVIDYQNVQYDELHFLTVNNVFEELMVGEKFYHVEDGRCIFYVFETSSENEDEWRSFVSEKVEYTCNLLLDKWNVSVIGVVSGTAEHYENLKFLYRNVMDVFELQNVIGGSGIYNTDLLKGDEEVEFIKEFIDEELEYAIKCGNYSEAMSVTEKIFQLQKESSYATQQVYTFEIFKVAIDVFGSYAVDSVQKVKALSYVETLMNADNTMDLKKCIEQLLYFICNEISTKWQTEGKTIVKKIQDFVDENYNDPNLGLSLIAENLKRNAKYISRVFIEEKGEGILDYINEIRIDRAVEIMKMKEYTLEEIAGMVGYSNTRTFRRAFVKKNGEIPSKFMK